VQVRPERSLVTALHGWRPSRNEQFPMVLTALPRPLTTVAVAEGEHAPPVPVAALLRTGLTNAYVRMAAPGESAALTVGAGPPAGVRITDRQGHATDVAATPERVLSALEHMARWLRLLDLTNPASTLGEPIRLEIVPAGPDERVAGLDTPALGTAEDGAYHLRYARRGSGWAAPEVFIRLHNTTGRLLHVTLLDLTPGYGAHATLFPVAPIGPGRHTAAMRGGRIRVSLPAGERPVPGRSIRDWLVVVASERPFSADPYQLPPLAASTRGDRERDLVVPPSVAGDDWTTQRFELFTEVPDDQSGSAESASDRKPPESSTVIVR
jgi:hypothetical protein